MGCGSSRAALHGLDAPAERSESGARAGQQDGAVEGADGDDGSTPTPRSGGRPPRTPRPDRVGGGRAFTHHAAVKHFFKGNQLMEAGSFRDAAQAFTRAVELRPDYAVAYSSRGMAYYAMGEYEKAVEDSTRALEINPEDAGAYQARADAYGKLGETDKAFDDYEKAGMIEQKRICIICMEHTRCTRLHPCLHSSMCGSCAKNLHAQNYPCPLCSTPIQHVEFGTFDRTFSFEQAFAAEEGEPVDRKSVV